MSCGIKMTTAASYGIHFSHRSLLRGREHSSPSPREADDPTKGLIKSSPTIVLPELAQFLDSRPQARSTPPRPVPLPPPLPPQQALHSEGVPAVLPTLKHCANCWQLLSRCHKCASAAVFEKTTGDSLLHFVKTVVVRR